MRQRLLPALMNRLFADNRIEDARLAAGDENVRRQLYKDMG